MSMTKPSVDVEDLEALFDQIVAQRQEEPAVQAAEAPPQAATRAAPMPDEHDDIYVRVGKLTRVLHNTLGELGYDKTLEASAAALPDARDRLAYIAQLTGKSAERSLAAVENGQAVQQELGGQAQKLATQWDRLYAKELAVEEFKQLAGDTRKFLCALPERASQTYAQLHEIMMAQDFHDLTGQVITKIADLASTMEEQLLKLLVENSAGGQGLPESKWRAGPVVNPSARADVVTNQTQVDELLDSLGF
jgi:chemotaxis protein CheZ